VTVIEIAGLGGLGLFAGLLIGCVGIGGVIVVPALTYIAGTPIQSSIAAAMMAYILSGAVGTAVYARNGSIRWPMAFWLSGGAMPAALLGARMSNVMQPLILEVSVGLLTLISGFYALVPRTADGSGNPEVPTLALACIGVVTGLLSAITGTGGPLVLIPILMWLHVPVLTAVGLSQAIQLPIAILATIGNVIYGTPDYVLGGLLTLGLTIGSWLGAKLAHHLPMATLKRIIALVLVAVGAIIIVKISQTLAL